MRTLFNHNASDPMTPSDLQTLKEAFAYAAANDPTPGNIVAHVNDKDLTAADRAKEVSLGTPTGQRIVEIYEQQMTETGTSLAQVVAALKKPKLKP